jgi:hypothetical protein
MTRLLRTLTKITIIPLAALFCVPVVWMVREVF